MDDGCSAITAAPKGSCNEESLASSFDGGSCAVGVTAVVVVAVGSIVVVLTFSVVGGVVTVMVVMVSGVLVVGPAVVSEVITGVVSRAVVVDVVGCVTAVLPVS